MFHDFTQFRNVSQRFATFRNAASFPLEVSTALTGCSWWTRQNPMASQRCIWRPLEVHSTAHQNFVTVCHTKTLCDLFFCFFLVCDPVTLSFPSTWCMRALMEGHSAICAALLGGRADIDARSSQQDTPLMWAAHLGLRLNMTETLQ